MGWGLAFGDDFKSLSKMESNGGELMLGTESDKGDLEKLSAEAKNAPLQQNYSKFWCFKHKIDLSGAVLS